MSASYALRDCLLQQHDIAWRLTAYHLEGLSTEECLWRPASRGLHLWATPEGWRPDWPEHEGYGIGPSSIAWLSWHLCFWWSMALDHAFDKGHLERDDVVWPGSAEALRTTLAALQSRWRAAIATLDDAALAASERTRWPFRDRPFGNLVAWANLELMKSAAEIGYVRFLYAART